MNLKIQNVTLSIKGKLIVNDVSITVNPGEVVGLMGPNGAGKTTTFNLAVGNLKPAEESLYELVLCGLPYQNQTTLFMTQEFLFLRMRNFVST